MREYKKIKYLEVKVVKVKVKYLTTAKIDKKLYGFFYDKQKLLQMEEIEKPKGNWVNGENLDKIKFPVPCSHKDKSNGYSGYGILMTGLNHHMDKTYILADIGKQRNELTTVSQSESLKDLIETWDIHILKGKIILFEEE